jgi:hypothetical protein
MFNKNANTGEHQEASRSDAWKIFQKLLKIVEIQLEHEQNTFEINKNYLKKKTNCSSSSHNARMKEHRELDR